MVVFRKFKVIALAVMVISCDYELEPAEDPGTIESILTRDWQYDLIVMDGDTILHQAFGEPSIDQERFSSIRLLYMRYEPDNSYELRSTANKRAYLGIDEFGNYQPNYGFWDIEGTDENPILVHNKTLIYETRYELTELSDERMVRKLIGTRRTYLWKELEFPPFQIDTLDVDSWIEVFVPKAE